MIGVRSKEQGELRDPIRPLLAARFSLRASVITLCVLPSLGEIFLLCER
jgi:hypothetical protein